MVEITMKKLDVGALIELDRAMDPEMDDILIIFKDNGCRYMFVGHIEIEDKFMTENEISRSKIPKRVFKKTNIEYINIGIPALREYLKEEYIRPFRAWGRDCPDVDIDDDVMKDFELWRRLQ